MTYPFKNVEVFVFPSGPFETNAYLVRNGADAAVIDPSPGSSEPLLETLAKKELSLSKIILTHSHWDHISDIPQLLEKYLVPVLVHADDVGNLISPGSDRLPCWYSLQPVKPDVLLKDGDEVMIGTSAWRVIHTPGHSPGSICLYSESEGILFSGDTLFRGTIGNLSFPTSLPEKMWDSLKKLEKLPPSTTIFPGHGSKTTIGQEKWLSRAKEVFGG